MTRNTSCMFCLIDAFQWNTYEKYTLADLNNNNTKHIYFWPFSWGWGWQRNTPSLWNFIVHTAYFFLFCFCLFVCFNLRMATLPYKATNFSSFLFILFSSSPTFLISISGNLMILLNMWVIMDCFVKKSYKCLSFPLPLFHLFMICHHSLLGCMS